MPILPPSLQTPMPIDVAQRNAQEFGSCSFVSVYYAIADTLFNSEEPCAVETVKYSRRDNPSIS